MKLYFSHPTFTYKTKTETTCLRILEKALETEEIINPSDYGIRTDPRELVDKADAVVGMAVSDKYTFLVWNEMDYGKSKNLDLYTLMVEDKNNIGPLVEGIVDDIEKLSKEESKRFSRSIMVKGSRESFFSIFIGNWGRRF